MIERERERERERKTLDFVNFCISCLFDLYPLQGNALMEEGKESFQKRGLCFIIKIYISKINTIRIEIMLHLRHKQSTNDNS